LQPPNTPKRVQDDDNEEEDHENEFKRQRKMRALAKSRAMEGEVVHRPQKPQYKEPVEAVVTEKPITDEERQRILKLVENEEVEVCILNFMESFSFENMRKSHGTNPGE
jgi:FtsZ-interacting cell division protein YlmF